MLPPTTPSERAVNALRRIAPATRALAAAVTVVAGTAGAAALALWATVSPGLVGHWPWGTVGALAIAVVLLAPAGWLWHASRTLRDLAALPDVPGRIARHPAAARDELAELRKGGVRQVIRTVRATVTEYGDVVGPWRAAVEVATPWFWAWTGSAAVAALVEVALVPLAAIAAALT